MMLQSADDKFIRKDTDKDISCTITDIKGSAAIVEYEYFKKALFPVSTVVLYEYQGSFYYPLALEFRLIDNNILYLTEELGINSIEEIFRILTSSMEKEERWSNEFQLAVVHLKSSPRFSIKLSESLKVGSVKETHVYE